jgi:hypothetical protein
VSTLVECGVREALLASPFREVYWITVNHGLDTGHPNPDDLTPQDAHFIRRQAPVPGAGLGGRSTAR